MPAPGRQRLPRPKHEAPGKSFCNRTSVPESSLADPPTAIDLNHEDFAGTPSEDPVCHHPDGWLICRDGYATSAGSESSSGPLCEGGAQGYGPFERLRVVSRMSAAIGPHANAVHAALAGVPIAQSQRVSGMRDRFLQRPQQHSKKITPNGSKTLHPTATAPSTHDHAEFTARLAASRRGSDALGRTEYFQTLGTKNRPDPDCARSAQRSLEPFVKDDGFEAQAREEEWREDAIFERQVLLLASRDLENSRENSLKRQIAKYVSKQVDGNEDEKQETNKNQAGLQPSDDTVKLSSSQGIVNQPSSTQLVRRGRRPPLIGPSDLSTTLPVRCRDRFIPPRHDSSISRTMLKTNKHPSTLTPAQKRTRRQTNKSDPFGVPRHHEKNYDQISNVAERFNTAYMNRQASMTAQRQHLNRPVWNVGGNANANIAPWDVLFMNAERLGHRMERPVSTPTFTSRYLNDALPAAIESQAYENRVALALDMDRSSRVLGPSSSSLQVTHQTTMRAMERSGGDSRHTPGPILWHDCQWMQDGHVVRESDRCSNYCAMADLCASEPGPLGRSDKFVPTSPYRTLEAPELRDDFYCTVIAHSSEANLLAVALGPRLWTWSEEEGISYPHDMGRNCANSA